MTDVKTDLVKDAEQTLERWGDWNNQQAMCKGYPQSDVSAQMLGAGGLPIPPLDDDTAMLINDALAPFKVRYFEAWQVAEALWIRKMPMSHKRFPVSYSKASRIKPMIIGVVIGKLYPVENY